MIGQKGYFDDLTEGKFSYPISHAIWGGSEDSNRIVETLRLKTNDPAAKAYVATCLKDFGSLARTRQVVRGLDERARSLLQEAPANPVLEKLLDKLTDGLERCN